VGTRGGERGREEIVSSCGGWEQAEFVLGGEVAGGRGEGARAAFDDCGAAALARGTKAGAEEKPEGKGAEKASEAKVRTGGRQQKERFGVCF